MNKPTKMGPGARKGAVRPLRGRAAPVLAAAAVLLAAGAARADAPIDARTIPPNVLFVLDTSGSMQYLQIEHRIPRCANDAAADDEDSRTRWMMIQDALLGPITGASYACERFIAGQCLKQTPDEECVPDGAVCRCRTASGGDLPVRFRIPGDWIIPLFSAYGTRDIPRGILERYRERVRFGLATFDALYSSQFEAVGMWSYPAAGEPIPWRDPHTGRIENIDVGVRRRDAAGAPVFGALTTWGGDDTDLNLQNAVVRNEILETPTYCGSPIAAAFQDARYFFSGDPEELSNKPPAAGGNDKFYNCRERFVVLITDGLPNTGEGNPYQTSARAANGLYTLGALPGGVPVFVIGFSLCPAGTTEGDEVRDFLDDVACQGCPTGGTHCLLPTCHALFADDTDELIAALDLVLGSATGTAVTSRTLAMSTNQVSPQDPATVVQYQFNTGLEVSTTLPWRGLLERTGYVCNPTTNQVEVSDDPAHYTEFGAKLDSRTTERQLRTVTTPPGGPRNPPLAAPVDLEAFTATNPNIDVYQLGCEGEECSDPSFVSGVVNYIHGAAGTPRATRRLADIYHASVAVAGRPAMELPIVSYYKFQEDQFERTQVVFAATNEGVLHAFRANNMGDSGRNGEELWGYLPNYLLPRVHWQLTGEHYSNLDSTPLVRDLRVFKSATSEATDDEWKTVVVGGYRQGGRGYYALDVTIPSTPKLLWEINSTTDDTSTVPPGDYANLWLTYATPFLGTVFIPNEDRPGRPLGEVAVTIFPGGYNPDNPTTRTTDLYVVSTKTGRLLKKLSPSFPAEYGCGGDCEAMPECCAQLVTTPVGYGALPGLVTTRVFVGDDRGRIWRADLASTNTNEWSLNLFYPHPSPPAGEPAAAYRVANDVKFPPALALDKENNLIVVFGTGDVDNVSQLDQSWVFSVKEKIEQDPMSGRYYGRAYYNWGARLEGGEKLTGTPIVFNNVAYFTTFLPITDSMDYCKMGEGRIWGVVYNDDDPDNDGDHSDWGALVDENPPAGAPTEGCTGTNPCTYVGYSNSYIAGLNVLQRPACSDASVPPIPGLGGATRETFEIVAQVGGGSSVGSRHPSQQVPTITIQIPTPAIANYADSWGGVFE
jgi:type IV pilus assembly protein PilY1